METPPRSQPSADERDEDSDDDVLFKFPQRGGEYDLSWSCQCHYQWVYRDDSCLFEGVGFPTTMSYNWQVEQKTALRIQQTVVVVVVQKRTNNIIVVSIRV